MSSSVKSFCVCGVDGSTVAGAPALHHRDGVGRRLSGRLRAPKPPNLLGGPQASARFAADSAASRCGRAAKSAMWPCQGRQRIGQGLPAKNASSVSFLCRLSIACSCMRAFGPPPRRSSFNCPARGSVTRLLLFCWQRRWQRVTTIRFSQPGKASAARSCGRPRRAVTKASCAASSARVASPDRA